MQLGIRIKGGDKFEKALQKIVDMNMGIKAGVLRGAYNADTGASIASYAYWNEYGTTDGHIPPRPFLRQTKEEKSADWCRFVEKNANFKQIEKDKCEGMLIRLGEGIKGNIKETIQKGSFTPDAESTVKAKMRKGKSEPNHPLIDTGDLLKSIQYELVKK